MGGRLIHYCGACGEELFADMECPKCTPCPSCAEKDAEIEQYKRLLDEQVDATNVVTNELNDCYAELGIFRHPSEPDRGPDAIKRLRETIEVEINGHTTKCHCHLCSAIRRRAGKGKEGR